MNKRRLVTLACSMLLVLVLLITAVLLACAPSAPTTQAPTTISPQIPSPTQQAPTTVSPTTKPAPAPAAETFNWKFTTTEPKGTDRWRAYEVFADALEKDSQGRLVLTLYPTGQLVKGVDMLEALGNDVIQMGNTYGPYWTEFIPETAVEGGFPFTLRTADEYYHVWYELGLLELVRETYAEHNTYYLAPAAGAGAYMWATEPIVNPDDFTGLKARGTGLRAQLLQEMGASPVYIPHEEGYTALQLGTVTAYETTLATYMSLKHYEVCKYVMTPGLLDVGVIGFVVSQKARDKLPEDLKGLLEAEGRNWPLYFYYLDLEAQDKMFASLPQYGAQSVRFSDATIAKMTVIGTELMEEYAAKSARTGKMVDIIKGYMRTKGYIN